MIGSKSDIHYLHNIIIHRFYPQKICIGIVLDFPLGHIHVLGEIANNHYAKFRGGGIKGVYYGFCASRN